MGFIEIIPMSIRLTLLYTKSVKVTKRTDKTNQEKVEIIKSKEAFWKGKTGFIPQHVGSIQSPAVCIGLKDMAGIFTSLNAPDEALRFIDSIGNSLMDNYNIIPKDNENAHKRQSIFEAQIFAWYYEAVAYAQKNNIEKVQDLFNKANQSLLAAIEEDPSNKRLNDVYEYIIHKTFNTYMDMANEHTENKQNIYRSCLNLLKTFDQRDPGNDTITEFIGRFY